MHIRTSLVLGLCIALPCSSFADFRYDETTKVTGGSLVSMAKLAGTFSKQAHPITDPVNSTILVKGNRMAHINPDSTEVIDLDQETITRMDHAKKQYTVVTFQEMKAEMEDAMRKAQAQPQQAPTPQPASTTPQPQLKFKVTVTNTGATKPVAGLSSSESILRMTAEATDQQSGQTGGMAITNDMWMVPEIPGYSEVRDFNVRMAAKMGTMFSGPCPKCGTPLHCCKQCSHFEPSTRFQCTKPVPVRIAVKDQHNECTLFSPRVTVAREVTNSPGSGGRPAAANVNTPPPRNASDARDAFDRLFKK